MSLCLPAELHEIFSLKIADKQCRIIQVTVSAGLSADKAAKLPEEKRRRLRADTKEDGMVVCIIRKNTGKRFVHRISEWRCCLWRGRQER